MTEIRMGVTYAGYAAHHVVAINDRTRQAIIRATGGGFIRHERKPGTYWGYVSHPHRKLGAALKAAGFTPREIVQVIATEMQKK
jgi:DNA-binding transcriptional regulator YdaS (Cro superfamily)